MSPLKIVMQDDGTMVWPAKVARKMAHHIAREVNMSLAQSRLVQKHNKNNDNDNNNNNNNNNNNSHLQLLELERDDLQIIQELGKGAFSVAYSVRIKPSCCASSSTTACCCASASPNNDPTTTSATTSTAATASTAATCTSTASSHSHSHSHADADAEEQEQPIPQPQQQSQSQQQSLQSQSECATTTTASTRSTNTSHTTYTTATGTNTTTTTAVYAMKHLKAELLQDPENFRLATAELAMEAHYLSSFRHENIIQIHGWSAMGLAAVAKGRHDGYFLLLDVLEETLDQRLQSWEVLAADRARERIALYHKHAHNPVKDLWRRFKGLFLTRSTVKERKKIQLLFQKCQDAAWHLEKLHILQQIASALAYLHQHFVIYRDLKPNNIGFRHGVVKLFDFGLSRELPSCDITEPFEMSGKVGTLRYMAVEVAKQEPYNTAADVYSWAMVLYEVMTLIKPFSGWTREMHSELVCERGVRPDVNIISSQLRLLTQACWAQAPSQRPTMSKVVSRLQTLRDRDAVVLASLQDQLRVHVPDLKNMLQATSLELEQVLSDSEKLRITTRNNHKNNNKARKSRKQQQPHQQQAPPQQQQQQKQQKQQQHKTPTRVSAGKTQDPQQQQQQGTEERTKALALHAVTPATTSSGSGGSNVKNSVVGTGCGGGGLSHSKNNNNANNSNHNNLSVNVVHAGGELLSCHIVDSGEMKSSRSHLTAATDRTSEPVRGENDFSAAPLINQQ